MSEPLGGAAAAPPPVRLPDPVRLFERRAARLAALAEGHAAPDWLLLLSRVAAGQARAVREVALPAAGDLLSGAPRDGTWRRMLAVVVGAARAPGLPAPTEAALRWLGSTGASDLEALADDVLAGTVLAERLACAPFVGAALGAWLSALAARVGPGALAPDREGACPFCGAPPVAGVVDADDRRRWLQCSLCATEWNVPRVRCVACDTAAGPEYLHVDADPGAKAEACPDCRTYVKLFDLAKRPGAEPAADDAATLALDLLLAEEGFHRAGSNGYVGAPRAP